MFRGMFQNLKIPKFKSNPPWRPYQILHSCLVNVGNGRDLLVDVGDDLGGSSCRGGQNSENNLNIQTESEWEEVRELTRDCMVGVRELEQD